LSFSDSANLFSSRITPRALSEIMYPALRASDSALSFVANVSHVIRRTPPAAAQHSSLHMKRNAQSRRAKSARQAGAI